MIRIWRRSQGDWRWVLARSDTGRIGKKFKDLSSRDEKALITFITAGDPELKRTEEIIYALERGGADIIELGIPFSEPMADGPTIQASSERALKNRINIQDILNTVRDIRRNDDIPIILFGYYNPIFNYGLKDFARDARDAGVDGVLVVDLPPEEADELKVHTDRNGLDLIFLLTPTSDEHRMSLVASKAKGFIYYVSVTGVTGARKELPVEIRESVERARRFTDLPICVGFGISTSEQARRFAEFVDGIVVGSAIVRIIEENQRSSELLDKIERFVNGLKQGMGKGQTSLY